MNPRQGGPHSNFFLLGASQPFAREKEVLTYVGFVFPGTLRTNFQIWCLRLQNTGFTVGAGLLKE